MGFQHQGERYQFYVLSILEAQGLKLPAPYIVISITDPGIQKHTKFVEDSNRLDILRLEFHDISKMTEGYEHITHQQSDQLVDFIIKYKDKVSTFVFHCEAGLCRSPGAAAAISLWLEHTDAPFYKQHQPNSRVKSIILRTLYRRGLT